MAACYLSSGYTLDCRTSSSGGLLQAWFLGGSGNTITGYTVTNTEITAVGGVGTWYNVQLPKQSASLTETLGVNTTSQSITFQPSIVLNLPKLDSGLRDFFVEMSSQNSIYAIVQDNNNRFFAVFFDNGGIVSAGALQSGQAYTDLNGASALTISGGEPTSIRQINAASVSALGTILTTGGFTFQS